MSTKRRSFAIKLANLILPAVLLSCAAADDGTLDSGEQGFYARLGRGELVAKRTQRGPARTHTKFQQYYRGVPVFEGELITHTDAHGAVSETNALRDIHGVDVNPQLTRDQAITIARGAGPTDGNTIVDAKLEVLPSGDHDARDRLTWHVRIHSEGGEDGAAAWDSFIDAHDGTLALSFDSLETTGATATGETAWSGNVVLDVDLNGGVYSLTDTTRGSGNYTCNLNHATSGCTSGASAMTSASAIFGDGVIDSTDPSTAGADAHYGLQQTWDFYQTVLGRNGIDGNGSRTYSRVHYSTAYDNAFWSDSCGCMTYGDGSVLHSLTTLDVAGHEMSHGVMSREAALTYRGESGGLNESNSDIFGTMVEFFTNSAVDVPDYKIGERLYKSNPDRALRYMYDPSLDGQSPACWSKRLKSLDVHYSSGPNNHMFWLLAEGGVSKCNNRSVVGIGRAAAARVWYLAISAYMTSSTTYAGARVAALNAANELAGQDPAVFGGAPKAVADAYAAINVP